MYETSEVKNRYDGFRLIPAGYAMADFNIGKKMDIIIDDGRHWPDYNLAFFNHSFEYLKEGGIFIIEDLFLSSHSKGDFRKHHYENLEKIKEMSSFADILRLNSKYGQKDKEGKSIGNNLMVILK